MVLQRSVALISQGWFRNQVQVVKRKDSERYEIVTIEELLSLESGFCAFIRACELLSQKNDGVIFVGVAGPSGAGKTVFTGHIQRYLPSAAIIDMDSYVDATRLIDGDFDDKRLTDYDRLLDNIRGLRYGRSVQVPIYDFKSNSRVGYRTVEVPRNRIVIIEGIYALSEKLRPFLDLRVSVTGGVTFNLVRRVLADVQHAGQNPNQIILRIFDTLYPTYEALIEPDLNEAHVKIGNNLDPFSFLNPTFILKSTKAVTPEQMKAVLSEDFKERTEETRDIYLLPPGEDPITCRSFLRMRNRDGKYYLTFQEWITEGAIVISPGITFEVNVRILGGLMSMGYTVAAISKRKSHVFDDDKVTVKIVFFEPLYQTYVQVRGSHHTSVKNVADQLGLEASSYVPRTYIEQMQLEKRVNRVTALPDDLMTKISLIPSAAGSRMRYPRGAPASPPATLPNQVAIAARRQREIALQKDILSSDRTSSTTQNVGRSTVPVLLALAIGWIGIIAYSLKK